MYIPKHYHWSLPVIIVMVGFYIGHHYGRGFDVIFAQFCLGFVACSHSLYLWQAGVIYQRFQAHEPEPTPQPKVAAQEIPYNNNGEQTVVTLRQVVDAPRFDLDRNFAIQLLRIREAGFEIDLTEEYWIKEAKRYKGSPANFRNMKHRFANAGALRRKNKNNNSPFLPDDWRIIELIACGEKPPALLN